MGTGQLQGTIPDTCSSPLPPHTAGGCWLKFIIWTFQILNIYIYIYIHICMSAIFHVYRWVWFSALYLVEYVFITWRCRGTFIKSVVDCIRWYNSVCVFLHVYLNYKTCLKYRNVINNYLLDIKDPPPSSIDQHRCPWVKHWPTRLSGVSLSWLKSEVIGSVLSLFFIAYY